MCPPAVPFRYSKYLINTKATRSAHCLRPSIEYFTNYSIADMLWQLIIDRHVSPRLPRLSQHFAHDIFKYWWKLILFREEAHTCMIEHLLCAGDKPERFACALREMAADDGLWVNMVGLRRLRKRPHSPHWQSEFWTFRKCISRGRNAFKNPLARFERTFVGMPWAV